MHLLDTDWVVDVLNDRPQASQTLLDLTPSGLALGIISYGELYEGAYYSRDPQAALAALQTFLQSTGILPLTHEIMERFAIVRGSLSRNARQQIGDMDLLIAATALAHNLTLLTRNLKDFQIIAHLKIYQP